MGIDHASGRTVWYTWRAPATGHATLKLAAVPEWPWYFEGAIAIFTGPTVSELTVVSAEWSEVGFTVAEGMDYHVAVDSHAIGVSGKFRLIGGILRNRSQ